MIRFPTLVGVLSAGALLYAASATAAPGERVDDDPLARDLVAAAEKHSDLQEVVAKYGRRAEIALTILQDQQVRTDLIAEIRDMQTVIATFPQNRRWWLADQQAYFQQKLARDRQLNELDRELGQLRLEEKRMYEEELANARAIGKGPKPFNREALLRELQRLDRESAAAVRELKEGIEAAAREERTHPRQVLDRVVARSASLDAPPGVEREFLPKFIKYAGGDSWLDGKNAPTKARKSGSRSRRNRS